MVLYRISQISPFVCNILRFLCVSEEHCVRTFNVALYDVARDTWLVYDAPLRRRGFHGTFFTHTCAGYPSTRWNKRTECYINVTSSFVLCVQKEAENARLQDIMMIRIPKFSTSYLLCCYSQFVLLMSFTRGYSNEINFELFLINYVHRTKDFLECKLNALKNSNLTKIVATI